MSHGFPSLGQVAHALRISYIVLDLMKWRSFLERWSLSGLELRPELFEAEFSPGKRDRAAAWELYIELLTRITTQALPAHEGDEKSALDSVHNLFPLTREILKRQGPGSSEFAKLAIPVLNQIVRPYTVKWHRLALAGAFSHADQCREFRIQLAELQTSLTHFARALADMARVEDLTEREKPAR